MSSLYAMIMIHDLSPRIKYATQKDMVSRLRAMTLLTDVLQLHYTHGKLLSPNPTQIIYHK